ncbi:uncharacterized protein [Antedon mediterranea]|uniref:uncharacterized protein n=1 Tax=Antedon mediterranea TaxID=105859 RepID=UPI003AF8A6FE
MSTEDARSPSDGDHPVVSDIQSNVCVMELSSDNNVNESAVYSEDVMHSTGDILISGNQPPEDILNSDNHAAGVCMDVHSTENINARRTTSVIVLNSYRTRMDSESEQSKMEMEGIMIESSEISGGDETHQLEVCSITGHDEDHPIGVATISSHGSTHQIDIGGTVYPYLATENQAVTSISIPIQIMTSCKAPPPGCPQWAARLKECQKVGTSYRGFVENEIELDLLLTFHKQETGSFWGTRQSPSAERSSKRLMWRSQYVPYDGIPFVNMGSRAVTMECQFGPRRKSKAWKAGSSKNYKTSCPARIYIKKVRKFLKFKASNINDKKDHDRVFQSIKDIGIDEVYGVERWYVQLPTIQAHDYHDPVTENVLQPMLELQRQETPAEERMNPKVAQKIQDLISEGISNDFEIRAKLRQYVLQELFKAEKCPDRHDPRYFPTINNIQNYKHEIKKAVEKGELILDIKVRDIEKSEDTKLINKWIEPKEDEGPLPMSNMAGNKLLSQINSTKTGKSNLVTCTEVSDIDKTNNQSGSPLPMMESENNQSNSLLQDSTAESLLSEMQNNQTVIESADHMVDPDQSTDKDSQ